MNDSNKVQPRYSFFDAEGFETGIDLIVDEIMQVYLADDVPWIVGYSGGKDSTATLQLVWMALRKIGSDAKKPVYVISTDTLVENPIIAGWVAHSLEKMNVAAKKEGLPISSHRLFPAVNESFWVNLIGRGYPAPRQKFRWCTERLKIAPSHRFISSVVDRHGETLLVLGTRKAESAARARVMAKHEQKRVRDKISPNGSLANSFIYSPIENWANDDVWMFLLETPNPWGHDNMNLFGIYKGATTDGECPLVVDTGTPSCGDSRFGCWVCTLVEKDKSMLAMVANDEQKKWMMPLLEIRAEIDFRAMPENGDRHLRDFRRMKGNVQLFHGRLVPGPYKQEFRQHLLSRLLQAEKLVRETGPEYVRDLTLIQPDELDEIRRIWVVEKHEIEDALPNIYEKATGRKYIGHKLDEGTSFGAEEMVLLREVCGDNRQRYEMLREFLAVESRHKTSLRRAGIFKSLEQAIKRNFYTDENDAVSWASEREVVRQANASDAELTAETITVIDADDSRRNNVA